MGSSMVIAYPIVLFTSITLLKQYPDAAWRPIVAVAPVIPILFGLRAFLRALNQMDELQRRIQLNAIAFAAGATGMVTVTYGFLENAGFPQLSWIWIFPMLIALWGISLPIVGRRYR
ncbi:cytochrome P450 [Chloroflexi bacterium TSY]|nr:cytochrome P450 [Chloroflexi bacterium TSY]